MFFNFVYKKHKKQKKQFDDAIKQQKNAMRKELNANNNKHKQEITNLQRKSNEKRTEIERLTAENKALQRKMKNIEGIIIYYMYLIIILK